MMFKLAQSAQKRWRRLNGHEQITYVLQGDKFIDGIRQAAA
jgi:putative transposase